MARRLAENVFAPLPLPPLPWPAEAVVAALEPVVLPSRAARIREAAAARIGSVAVVLDSLADPHNVAAILRTCDGLGVGEVHAVVNDTPVLMTTRVTKGCERWMQLRRHAEPASCAEALKARGFEIWVADMRATRPLEDLARIPRVALVMGNEHQGVSDALRARADGAFAVPMRGMVESYNVSVATAMALYEVTRGRAGDLDPAARIELEARWFMESVREPAWVVERWLHDRARTGAMP